VYKNRKMSTNTSLRVHYWPSDNTELFCKDGEHVLGVRFGEDGAPRFHGTEEQSKSGGLQKYHYDDVHSHLPLQVALNPHVLVHVIHYLASTKDDKPSDMAWVLLETAKEVGLVQPVDYAPISSRRGLKEGQLTLHDITANDIIGFHRDESNNNIMKLWKYHFAPVSNSIVDMKDALGCLGLRVVGVKANGITLEWHDRTMGGHAKKTFGPLSSYIFEGPQDPNTAEFQDALENLKHMFGTDKPQYTEHSGRHREHHRNKHKKHRGHKHSGTHRSKHSSNHSSNESATIKKKNNNGANGVYNTVKSGIKKAASDVESGAKKVASNVESGAKTVVKDAESGAKKAASDVESGAKKAAKDVEDVYEDLKTDGDKYIKEAEEYITDTNKYARKIIGDLYKPQTQEEDVVVVDE